MVDMIRKKQNSCRISISAIGTWCTCTRKRILYNNSIVCRRAVAGGLFRCKSGSLMLLLLISSCTYHQSTSFQGPLHCYQNHPKQVKTPIHRITSSSESFIPTTTQLYESQHQSGSILLGTSTSSVQSPTTSTSALSAYTCDTYYDGSEIDLSHKKCSVSVGNIDSLAVDNMADNSEYYERTLLKQSQSKSTTIRETLLPILSASLLITSNTVGAGCLVLPDLARDGPGFAVTVNIFLGSYVVNLLSGLIIAQIAINQKEQSGTDSPSSFKEFAQVNLKSDSVAVVVSALSIFVNACVLSFDLDRVGTILSSVVHEVGAVALSAPIFSSLWACAIVSLLCTQTNIKLSQISNVLVSVLFLSFGALLIPGLANVADPIGTITALPNIDSSESMLTSITYSAPIVLMSMIYQNIVPTVTKLLNYDRVKTVASLVLGSSIPLVLYVSWIYANLGGGIDISSIINSDYSSSSGGVAALLLTVFSLVTIGGSSLCGSISMAEELETFFPLSAAVKGTKDTVNEASTKSAFQFPAVFPSVAVPLVAALVWSGTMTDALAVAGSVGSPLLYGAIPAYIAYQQQQTRVDNDDLNAVIEQKNNAKEGKSFTTLFKQPETVHFTHNNSKNLVPFASLPVLGVLSTGYVGQELFQRASEILYIAS